MTGKTPTDRGKLGTKRTLMTDADGVPVGLVVDGANVHGIRLLQETIENCLERAPRLSVQHEEHLRLGKGYDSAAIRELVGAVYGFTSHIRSRGEENCELKRKQGERPRRWVVERTHGWLNRFRAVLIRCFGVKATLDELRTFKKFLYSLTSLPKYGGKVLFRWAYWIGAGCETGALERQ